MIAKITDDIIDDVLFNGRTFMILFYSNKLPNLENIFKMFDNFDEKFCGKIDIYTCAIDEETGKLAQYFLMSTVPAMVIMKNNKPYANIAGQVSNFIYEEAIKKALIQIMNEQNTSNESVATKPISTDIGSVYSSINKSGGGYKTIT
jgi:hypothetical protein